jgi:hypothetical protein
VRLAYGCLVFLVLWLFVTKGPLGFLMMRTETPVEMKLAEWSHGPTIEAEFVAPEGSSFELVVSPSTDGSLTKSSGELTLSSRSKPELKWAIAPEAIQECNWLAKRGLKGYIITWPTTAGTGNVLDNYIRAGENYRILLRLDAPFSPEGCSLWLVYLRHVSIFD